MDILDRLRAVLGADHVLTGAATAKWQEDWTGKYTAAPLAVLRPATTAEVAAALRIAHETGTPVVPVSGNTGLVGGTMTTGGLML
ncbi:MAG: FAD-binding oxidoreductase, partial [Rhodobacterales bacterium]|nr:FAD-binding oxidoreductase [Rhodobacterales bacterium]